MKNLLTGFLTFVLLTSSAFYMYASSINTTQEASSLGIHFNSHLANALWIEPSRVYVVEVGTKFNLTIWLNLTEDSFSWQMDLLFNTTCFSVTRAEYTAVSQSEFFVGHTSVPMTLDINNIEGYILAGETLVGADFREPGYGSLVWIEFMLKETLVLGSSISFSRPYGQDTFILTPDLSAIEPLTMYDSVVSAGSDLAVTEVTISKSFAYQGWPVEILAKVKNLGGENATFNVRLLCNDTLLKEFENLSLSAGQEAILNYTWRIASGDQCGTFVVTAEIPPLPDEVDETNNSMAAKFKTETEILQIWLQGDLNLDGKVDMRDIGAAARNFGKICP